MEKNNQNYTQTTNHVNGKSSISRFWVQPFAPLGDYDAFCINIFNKSRILIVVVDYGIIYCVSYNIRPFTVGVDTILKVT